MEISPENKEKKLQHPVYFVKSENDSSVLVGMDVRISGNSITWFDTNKDRIMGIEEIIKDDNAEFEFKRSQSEGGGTYSFSKMTLDIFRNEVKDKLIFKEDAESEEEMIKKFEETKNNAW